MTDVGPLRAALDGRLAAWHWSAGLSPEVVAGIVPGLEPEPGPFRGREGCSGVAEVPAQREPVRFVWVVSADGAAELELVEVRSPTLTPTTEEAIAELGPPSEVVPFGRGPFSGADQRVHLDRGLTVFDGFNHGIAAVWLYPPLADLDEYLDRYGATENVRRMSR